MAYRNKKLLEKVREIPRCSGCDKWNDGTIVACHANWIMFGKGRGIKVPDNYVAGMCFICHKDLDSGNGDKDSNFYFWLRAYIKTTDWLFEEGYLSVKN